ncbi:MAG: multidrug transporter [Candidatus Paceibacterota bacterium]
MDLFLQLWGGICYLLNKVFLSYAESLENNKRLKVLGWSVYLIGLPAWVIILVAKHNWIAAAIETGGAPAMVLGLVIALRGVEHVPNWLSKGAEVCVYIFLAIGFIYSLYDFGGITAMTQVLELGVMAGFLVGSYMLAKNNPNGWLWFMIMNGSMGTLMFVQEKPILGAQQLASLCFVIFGFIRSKRNR